MVMAITLLGYFCWLLVLVAVVVVALVLLGNHDFSFHNYYDCCTGACGINGVASVIISHSQHQHQCYSYYGGVLETEAP